MKAILIAIGMSLLVGGVSAMLVSRSVWGYYFHRPDVPREIRQARELRSVTPLRSTGKGTTCGLEMAPEYSFQDRMQWARDEPY